VGEAPRKSYYQISFTANQALAGLLVLILALAASFFFGARAGFERAPAPAPRAAFAAAATPAAVPAASVTAAPSAPPPPSAPIEAPAFEDREAGLGDGPPPAASPSRTVIAGRTGTEPPRSSIPSRPAPRTAPAPAGPGAFYVQVLSTSSHTEAVRWQERLAARKFHATVSSVAARRGRMYRVRLGPFRDKERAKDVAERVSSEFHRDAWVAPAE
jgi:hypothetical protein